MSVGLSFIRCAINNGGPATFIVDNGLSRDDFSTNEQQVLDYIESHITSYSVFPSLEAVQNTSGVLIPDIPNEPIVFWKDRVRERSLANKVNDGIARASRLLQEGRYSELTEQIKQMGADAVATQENIGYDTLSNLSQKVAEIHDERALRTSYDVVEVPFGFPYLDQVSDGIQPGDTIALVGKEGIGKSYLMCRMAKAAHDVGKIPLIISMEMSNVQLARRLLALRTRINENRLRKGQLSTFIGRRIIAEDLNIQRESETPFYLLDGSLVLKVEDLTLYAKALHPDVIYIDGAYLLKTRAKADSRWTMIAESAEAVKILSRRTNIPIVGSYQFNKEGNIYGSRAIKQLASVVLHLEEMRTDDSRPTWSHIGARKLSITKGRYGEKGVLSLTYNMHNASIEQDQVLTGYLSSLDIEEGDIYDED